MQLTTRRVPAPPGLRLILAAGVLATIAILTGGLATSCNRAGSAPAPYVAFVANNQSDSVAAVDLSALRVIRSIPVAAGPAEIAERPLRHELYVTSAGGNVSVIGYPELRVLRALRLGSSAQGLVFSADGERFYALDPAAGDVVFGGGQDGQNPQEAGRAHLGGKLSGLALTPDGRTLVVVEAESNRLAFVGTESRRTLGFVSVGKDPDGVAVLPDSSKVFVADTGEHKISAVDIASRRLLAHLELASRPTGLALKPDGGEMFVLCGESALVSIVDTFNDDIEENLPTARSPAAAVFRRDSTVLYLASADGGSVTALDVPNRVVLDSTRAGGEPRALALTPDERFLVMADAASSSVAVLHAVTTAAANGPDRGALVTTIPVGAKPVALVIPNWLPKRK